VLRSLLEPDASQQTFHLHARANPPAVQTRAGRPFHKIFICN
jgi:hypothetical protein